MREETTPKAFQKPLFGMDHDSTSNGANQNVNTINSEFVKEATQIDTVFENNCNR